jgi:hypothetical protein
MDYLIDGRIKIDGDPEHKSLYSWSLNEIDANGGVGVGNQIPWDGSFYFIGSLFQVVRNTSYGEVYGDDGEKIDRKIVSQEVKIIGHLHSGDCIDGRSLEDTTIFSMFGSKRKIEFFRLEIRAVENENDEICRIDGIPSFSYELDFRQELSADYVGVLIYVCRKKFEEISNLIERKIVDHAQIRLTGVSGIYSDWSPSIFTSRAKILTKYHLDLIDGDDEIKSTLPTLGDIEEFSLTIISKNELNVKIDQNPASIDKYFDDDMGHLNVEGKSEYKFDSREENSVAEELGRHLILQINELQKATSKINIAIWILVIILIVQALN